MAGRDSNRLDKIFYLSIVFCFSFLLSNQKVFAPDAFIHIKLGEYIIKNFSIPEHDPFVYTYSENRYPDSAWLSQVVFYCLHSSSGFQGLVLFTALLVGITYCFILLSVYNETQKFPPSVLLAILIAFVSAERFVLRPHIFSFVFLAFILWAITDRKYYLRNKFIYFLIFAAWANLHAGFLYGLVLIAARLAGDFLDASFLNKQPHRFINLKESFKILLSSAAGSILTPHSFTGYIFAWGLTGLRSKVDVLEWRTLLETKNFALISMVILTCLLAITSMRKKILWHWFVFLVFVPAAFWAWRNAYEFLIVIAPAAGVGVTEINDWLKRKGLLENFRKRFSIYSATGLPIMLIAFFLGYFFLTDYHSMLGPGRGGRYYPEGALSFIKKHALPDNLFNSMNFGGATIFKLYPERRVFIDGLSTGIAIDFLENYVNALEKGGDFEGLLSEYNVNTLLVESDRGYIKGEVLDMERWSIVYWDDISMVLVRKNFAGGFNELAVGDLSDIIDRIAVAQGEELEFYRTELIESIEAGNSFMANLGLGMVYARERKFEEAVEFLEDAFNRQRYSFICMLELARAYRELGYIRASRELYRRILFLDGGFFRIQSQPFRLSKDMRKIIIDEYKFLED